MNEYTFKEIKLSDLESAYHTYRFLHADLRCGLNYTIDDRLANKTLSTLASQLGETCEPVQGIDSNELLNLCWSLIKRIQERRGESE